MKKRWYSPCREIKPGMVAAWTVLHPHSVRWICLLTLTFYLNVLWRTWLFRCCHVVHLRKTSVPDKVLNEDQMKNGGTVHKMKGLANSSSLWRCNILTCGFISRTAVILRGNAVVNGRGSKLFTLGEGFETWYTSSNVSRRFYESLERQFHYMKCPTWL